MFESKTDSASLNSYKIQCPNCGAPLRIRGNAQVLRCTYCHTEVALPQSSHTVERPIKKPFYWRYLLYLWLLSFVILGILLLVFSTNDPSSSNWIRQHRTNDFIRYDLFIGILCGLVICIIRGGIWCYWKIHALRHPVKNDPDMQQIIAMLEEDNRRWAEEHRSDPFSRFPDVVNTSKETE